MTRIAFATAATLSLLVLGACGHSTTDRALSGAAIGAGTGAAGSTVLGGDPVTGALAGGAVGGATGALTNSRDIDLGEPIWR